MKQALHIMKTIFAPKVIVPAVIGGGLLVALIMFAGPQQALRLISHFHPGFLIAFFLLTAE
jgi:hypothetical protein